MRTTTTSPASVTRAGPARCCWSTAKWPGTSGSRRGRRCWTTRTAPAPVSRRPSPPGPSPRFTRSAWGAEGIFAYVQRTTYRIPRFQLRGEIRVNHSNQPFFETSDGLSQWGVQYTVQLVSTF